MYIGLAISQRASAYVLRLYLPEKYRTQGLAFSVIPYYLADLVSGLLLGFYADPLLFVRNNTGSNFYICDTYRIKSIKKI